MRRLIVQSSAEPGNLVSRTPFWISVTHHEDWACERGIGEGGVGKAVRCGGEKGGKATQEKIRGRPGATPRQGRHRALARSSGPRPCARQNSRWPSYLIRISSTSENWKLELTHSPFQNTRFPNDYELLEAVDWLGTVHSPKNSRSCTPPVHCVTVRQHPEDCRNCTPPPHNWRSCPRMRSGLHPRLSAGPGWSLSSGARSQMSSSRRILAGLGLATAKPGGFALCAAETRRVANFVIIS